VRGTGINQAFTETLLTFLQVKEILKCDLDEMKFREVTECFGSSTPVVDWMKVMANSAVRQSNYYSYELSLTFPVCL